MADVYQFTFMSGWLALDFSNTLDQDFEGVNIERLNHYADLVGWAQQANLISEARAHDLMAAGERSPNEAQNVLARAVELRGVIYRIFSAVSAGRTPPPNDIDELNVVLNDAARWLRVDAQPDGGFGWALAKSGQLDEVLWPVAWSAAQLLVSDLLERVHECNNDRCTWMFIDETRNHSRRWCSMEGCGNRMKARRHYRRAKGKASD